MNNVWLVLIQLGLRGLTARLNNKPLDAASAAAEVVAAGRFAYEQEKGEPLDEALVKPYEPIP